MILEYIFHLKSAFYKLGTNISKTNLDIMANHSIRRGHEAFADVLETATDMLRLKLDEV